MNNKNGITRFNKNLAVVIAVSLTLCGACISIPTKAFAASSVDYRSTTFAFKMTTKGKTQGTSFRAKTTKSSVYMRVNKKTGSSCRIHVDGKKGSEIRDCTIKTAVLKKTGDYRIRNTVKEYGYTAARLTSWANIGASTVGGYWCPNYVSSWNATTLNP